MGIAEVKCSLQRTGPPGWKKRRFPPTFSKDLDGVSSPKRWTSGCAQTRSSPWPQDGTGSGGHSSVWSFLLPGPTSSPPAESLKMTFPLLFLRMARKGLREEAVYDEGKQTSCRGEEMPCSLTRLCLRPHSSLVEGPLLTRPSKLSATASRPPPPPRPLAQSRVQRPFFIQSMVPPVRMWTSLGTIVLSHPLTTAYVLSQDRTCFWTKPGMGSGPAPHDLELNIVSDFKIKLSAMRFRFLGRGWPAPFQKLLESS